MLYYQKYQIIEVRICISANKIKVPAALTAPAAAIISCCLADLKRAAAARGQVRDADLSSLTSSFQFSKLILTE
jgi:hypothetical protein